MREIATQQRPSDAPPFPVIFAAQEFEIAPGENVTLNGQVFQVVDVWIGPLLMTPAFLVERALDPLARTWAGVRACLESELGRPVSTGQKVSALAVRHVGAGLKIAGPATQIPNHPSEKRT